MYIDYSTGYLGSISDSKSGLWSKKFAERGYFVLTFVRSKVRVR